MLASSLRQMDQTITWHAADPLLAGCVRPLGLHWLRPEWSEVSLLVVCRLPLHLVLVPWLLPTLFGRSPKSPRRTGSWSCGRSIGGSSSLLHNHVFARTMCKSHSWSGAGANGGREGGSKAGAALPMETRGVQPMDTLIIKLVLAVVHLFFFSDGFLHSYSG